MSVAEAPLIPGITLESSETVLPEGWRWVRLGDVAKYINGRAFKPDDWATTGVPIIRIQNLTTTSAAFNYFEGKVEPRYLVDDGDLLISWSASLDAFIWIRGPAILNQHIFKVIEDSQVVTRDYLFYAARSVMEQIRSQVHGATMQHITRPEFEAIRIPLPPLPEQKRIAAILNEQLAAVEKARLAAQAQLEAARALPAAYLREVFESAEAQSWPRKRLADFAPTCSGTTPSRGHPAYYHGTIPWVKTGELRDNIIADTEEHVSELAVQNTSLRLLPVDTLLIAMYGQGQTRGRTARLAVPATTNQACFAILPRADQFDSAYLQWWFRHSYSRLRRETEGRGGNQPNLNGDVLREQTVPLPSISDQLRLAEKLSNEAAQSGRALKALQAQMEAINQLPATLLREAFSGGL